jgi:hypothetical protein
MQFGQGALHQSSHSATPVMPIRKPIPQEDPPLAVFWYKSECKLKSAISRNPAAA